MSGKLDRKEIERRARETVLERFPYDPVFFENFIDAVERKILAAIEGIDNQTERLLGVAREVMEEATQSASGTAVKILEPSQEKWNVIEELKKGIEKVRPNYPEIEDDEVESLVHALLAYYLFTSPAFLQNKYGG